MKLGNMNIKFIFNQFCLGALYLQFYLKRYHHFVIFQTIIKRKTHARDGNDRGHIKWKVNIRYLPQLSPEMGDF